MPLLFSMCLLIFTILKVHTELLYGCKIKMVICYNYFLLFLLFLFISTETISPNNLPTQILSPTLLCVSPISQRFFYAARIFVRNPLYSFRVFLLCAKSARCTSSSYYWHNYSPLFSQPLTTPFPFMIMCDIRCMIKYFLI